MKKLLLACIVILGWTGCAEQNSTQQNIQRLESKAGKEELPREEQKNLAELYGEAAENAEDEDVKVEYLWKEAEVLRNLMEHDQAIDNYKIIYNEHPDSERAPAALFLHAFIMDENKRNYDEADKLYMSFLEKYPTSDFGDDAKFLLDHLGTSDEDILRELISKDSL